MEFDFIWFLGTICCSSTEKSNQVEDYQSWCSGRGEKEEIYWEYVQRSIIHRAIISEFGKERMRSRVGKERVEGDSKAARINRLDVFAGICILK